MTGAGLAALFTPRSIAVVGASELPGLARDLLLTLRSRGYPGAVYAVNPRRTEVLGQPCYPNLESVPSAVDLAIALVPSDAVPGVVAQCARRGIRGVVVCAAGFAELGPQGQDLQATAGRLAREGGVHLLGPNCIGFLNVPDNVPAIAIPPASIPQDLRSGPVGVIAQSAGLMISALEYGAQIGLGFSLLVSTGNEEQVSALDCLDHLIADAQTRVIGLILEDVRHGRRLLDLAARAHAAGKPIVVLKLGRSARGAEATLTHTAALAGSPEVFDAVSEDAGIASVATVSAFVDHLMFLSKWRSSSRGGLAAMTISGGAAVLVADLAEHYGVRLASLDPATRERLARALPGIGVASNPLDLTAAAIEQEEVLDEVVDALDAADDVGVIALVMHLRKQGGSAAHQRLIRRFVAHHERVATQLVVISTVPEGISGFWREEAATSPVPFLNDLTGLAALRALTLSSSEGSGAASGSRPTFAFRLPPEIGALLNNSRPVLDEPETYRLLSSAGIPVAPYERVESCAEAADAADRLGYPVALKFTAAGVTHKTSAGLVHLDLRSRADVARAYQEVAAASLRAGRRLTGALVQRMVGGGIELLLGARLDPRFGPVVVIGLGGVWAELLDEVAVGVAPLTPEQARALIRRLRPGRGLEDLADAQKVDLGALAEVVHRFSLLASHLAPRVTSLEVNPLIATAQGCFAVDALAALSQVAGAAAPDP